VCKRRSLGIQAFLDLSGFSLTITIGKRSLRNVHHKWLVFDHRGAQLETNITVRNGKLSDEIQETINQKVSKLPRFFDRTTAIQVVADMRHSDTPKVEIIVSAEESNDFVASDTGTNVLSAVESAIQKMEIQLKKHKEKIKGHRG
jgi:putative sigma-54 modulation protein